MKRVGLWAAWFADGMQLMLPFLVFWAWAMASTYPHLVIDF